MHPHPFPAPEALPAGFINLLPLTMRQLATVPSIGLGGVLTLVMYYGGTRIRFADRDPARGKLLADLTELLGASLATALLEHMSGCEIIDIPLCQRALIVLKRRAIVERLNARQRANAESVAHIAREFRTTEREVYRIQAAAQRAASGEAIHQRPHPQSPLL